MSSNQYRFAKIFKMLMLHLAVTETAAWCSKPHLYVLVFYVCVFFSRCTAVYRHCMPVVPPFASVQTAADRCDSECPSFIPLHSVMLIDFMCCVSGREQNSPFTNPFYFWPLVNVMWYGFWQKEYPECKQLETNKTSPIGWRSMFLEIGWEAPSWRISR